MSSEFITFAEFEDRLPGLTRRTFERLSAQGEAPPGARLSPHGKPIYRREAIETWIAERLGSLAEVRA